MSRVGFRAEGGGGAIREGGHSKSFPFYRQFTGLGHASSVNAEPVSYFKFAPVCKALCKNNQNCNVSEVLLEPAILTKMGSAPNRLQSTKSVQSALIVQ